MKLKCKKFKKAYAGKFLSIFAYTYKEDHLGRKKERRIGSFNIYVPKNNYFFEEKHNDIYALVLSSGDSLNLNSVITDRTKIEFFFKGVNETSLQELGISKEAFTKFRKRYLLNECKK